MQIICPVCKNKLGNVPHYSKCNPNNLSNVEIKNWVFEFNFSEFIQVNSDKIKHMYVNEQRSIDEISKYYNLSWGKMKRIIEKLGIDIRSLKEAASTDRTRQKYKTTCNQLYGADNALSNGTIAYNKRNSTVNSKYGVKNVRQSTQVKEKINQTMLTRYGVLRISKLPKFGKNIQNKLESRISSALTRLDIGHTFSYYVNRRQFDFLINGTKILIEVQGDFWHANPIYYKSTDQIKFINNIKLVSSIWADDLDKKRMAESYGYSLVYVWESDITKLDDDNLDKWILNLLSSELRRLLPDQE